MIRVLAMIAVAGAIVSAITISIAIAIVGPAAIANGAWSWGPGGWGDHGGHWRHGPHFGWTHFEGRGDDGPQTSREIAWTGGDSLIVDVPADVTYTQAAGAPKLIVNGPKGAVDDVTVENGRIRYTDDREHDAHLTITLAAPSVNRFTLESSGALAIAAYKQDRLEVSVDGDADVKAAGEAKAVQVTISGSGRTDLGALKTSTARVEIDGSGDATLAPTDEADVDISGSGDVDLLTNPPKLHTHVSGSGSVRHGGRTDPGRNDSDE